MPKMKTHKGAKKRFKLSATGKVMRSHPIKLNAAYAEGGPQLTVRTVEHMTKVKIDHYVEVDFTSFMRTVDVLGGVEICVGEDDVRRFAAEFQRDPLQLRVAREVRDPEPQVVAWYCGHVARECYAEGRFHPRRPVLRIA